MKLPIFTILAVAPLAGKIAPELADRALQFARQGDLKSAEAELRKAIALAPADPAILGTLGGILAFDYDRDGKLDLFIANYAKFSWNRQPHCHYEGRPIYCAQTAYEGDNAAPRSQQRRRHLYRRDRAVRVGEVGRARIKRGSDRRG